MMFLALLWVYIHTGQAEKYALPWQKSVVGSILDSVGSILDSLCRGQVYSSAYPRYGYRLVLLTPDFHLITQQQNT